MSKNVKIKHRVISEKAGELTPSQFKEKYIDGRKVSTQKRYLREYLRQRRDISLRYSKQKGEWKETKTVGREVVEGRPIKGRKKLIKPKTGNWYIGGVAVCIVSDKEIPPHYCHFILNEDDRVTGRTFVELHNLNYPNHRLIEAYSIHGTW